MVSELLSEEVKKEVVVEAPGRINLIGEHIDYNGGHVLPAAIGHRIAMSFTKTAGHTCVIHSKNYNDTFTIDLTKVQPSATEWHNYILGVLHHIDAIRPNSISGFICELESNLPIGAGISSSAALECGIAKGLNQLFNLGLTDIEIIKISQKAEHTYVGTQCGIMDQFAVVMGKKGKVIKLNCDTLQYDYINADFKDYQLVLINTNVSHNLASSEYNTRRKECETALEAINQKYPEYKDLVAVPQAVIEEFKETLPANIYNRALYVTQENQRTLLASEALHKGNLEAFGEYLYQSHEGLQHLYEVSCEELDFLVAYAKNHKKVLGSRMMGGGFGGCTINLIHTSIVDTYLKDLAVAYTNEFNLTMDCIEVSIGEGVSIL